MDLDIGCRAHPGPLLHFESILPITKPVGVSNDLMFSAPKTPFMDLVINSLETFNHEWLFMPYPTVMFSTGPMFISAIYSMWCRILQRGVGIDPSQKHLYQRVRILPKSLYGKNILPEDAPHSFYWHYYGSSWHAGDAGFIGFVSCPFQAFFTRSSPSPSKPARQIRLPDTPAWLYSRRSRVLLLDLE